MAERLFDHLTIDGDEAKLDGAVIKNLENNSEFSELKSDLSNVVNLYTFSRLYDSWSKGTWHSTNGMTYSANNYIRANTTFGSSLGDNEVKIDTGYYCKVFAYDLTGTYIGILLQNGTFAKSWSSHAEVNEFSFVEYPEYIFRIAVSRNDKSESITTDENINCHIISRQVDKIKKDVESLENNLSDFIDGIQESLDLSLSDDDKTYGFHDIPGHFYKGTTVTVTNNNASNNNLTIYVKDGDTILQQVGVRQGSTSSFALVGNADMIRVYCNVFPTSGSITIEPVDIYQNKEIEKLNGYHGIGNDIVLMNAAVPTKLQNAQKLNWSDTIVPFSILHFSDPHGSTTTVERIIQYSDYISSYIDDIICTGDMVNNKYSDGYSWWDDIDGSENILTCIGNHDVSDGVVYNSYRVSPSDAYDAYFAPYISNWDVEHTGSLTYYYKDYAAKKIRLIVLDYLLTGSDATAQNTWLQSVLAGAKTNGYTVIIAEHSPVCNTVYFPCNFTMIDKSTVYTQFSETYQASVQDFVNGGGKFACYLVGHTHCDMICYNPNYPNQLCITVTIAAQTGRDNDQVRSGKARDAFNIVTVDTNSETIKLTRVGADIDNYLRGRNVLTLSYANKSIIAEY